MTDRQMHRRGERGERDTDMNRQSDAQTERKRGERYRQTWTDSLIHRRGERGEIDTDMNKQSDAQTGEKQEGTYKHGQSGRTDGEKQEGHINMDSQTHRRRETGGGDI